MTEIIPAILSQDFKDIERKLLALGGLVKWVQLDVSDGDFTPAVTWSAPEELNELDSRIKIEVHLMIRNPELELPGWLAVADRIIFHYEATSDPERVLEAFGHLPNKRGLALLLKTPLEIVDAYVDRLDVVQLMSIAKIGEQGLPFDERVIGRVQILHRRFPHLAIAVDGGVNLDNAPALLEAGATRLVVGSAFWQEVAKRGVDKAMHSWRCVVTS